MDFPAPLNPSQSGGNVTNAIPGARSVQHRWSHKFSTKLSQFSEKMTHVKPEKARLIPPFPGPSKSSETRKPSAPKRYETVTTSEWLKMTAAQHNGSSCLSEAQSRCARWQTLNLAPANGSNRSPSQHGTVTQTSGKIRSQLCL